MAREVPPEVLAVQLVAAVHRDRHQPVLLGDLARRAAWLARRQAVDGDGAREDELHRLPELAALLDGQRSRFSVPWTFTAWAVSGTNSPRVDRSAARWKTTAISNSRRADRAGGGRGCRRPGRPHTAGHVGIGRPNVEGEDVEGPPLGDPWIRPWPTSPLAPVTRTAGLRAMRLSSHARFRVGSSAGGAVKVSNLLTTYIRLGPTGARGRGRSGSPAGAQEPSNVPISSARTTMIGVFAVARRWRRPASRGRVRHGCRARRGPGGRRTCSGALRTPAVVGDLAEQHSHAASIGDARVHKARTHERRHETELRAQAPCPSACHPAGGCARFARPCVRRLT